MLMMPRGDGGSQGLFCDMKIEHHVELIQTAGAAEGPDDPIMSVQRLQSAIRQSQLVRRAKLFLNDNPEHDRPYRPQS